MIVTPGNVAPIAQDDNSTSDGNSVAVAVLSNDSDADGDTLSIDSITQPSNGSAVIRFSQVIYTPNQGFAGIDTLDYTLSDGNGHSTTASITIIVTQTSNGNVAPVAQDDNATSNGTPVTIDVLNNDSDADNDPLNIIGFTHPNNGSVAAVNGQIVYTPDQAFSGTDTFTYTISDGKGHSTIASVSVVVTGASNNVAPVAQPDQATSTGSSISVNALSNDTDADGDTLSIVSNGQPQNGQASIANGQLLYTPSQGFTGVDSFTYTISDGNNHTSSSVISINVTAAAQNQAPDVNNDQLGVVEANQPFTFQPLNNDSDPDGDALQVVSVGSTPNGTAIINADGSITFNPRNNYCGDIQFTYTVTDGNGHNKTATVFLQTDFLSGNGNSHAVN